MNVFQDDQTPLPKKPFPSRRRHPGFALVATISILVLLALIAVGLLSLSTVTLKEASKNQNMAEARANARLALVLAIGQLQKAAGPDQRITAPATLIDKNHSPALAGVWESLRLDPENHPNLESVKKAVQTTADANGEFVGWLTSDFVGGQPELTAPDLSPSNDRAVVLNVEPDPVSAKIIDVKEDSGLGWITIDEGVKSRFELPELTRVNQQVERGLLRAPARPRSQTMVAFRETVADSDAPTIDTAAKIASFKQGELAVADPQSYRDQFHHLTPWAAGLPADVSKGGLKKDLTLAFEQDTIPGTMKGRHVYADDQSAPLVPADPYFTSLREHYRLYHDNHGPGNPLVVTVPSGYRPAERSRISPGLIPVLNAHDGALVAPVVTRVNVAFSLVTREAHGHWVNTIPERTGEAQRNKMVYMIYTPVVTLYNPYTAPISVDGLQVTFSYLPLAFQFYRGSSPQTAQPALLNQFHIQSQSKTDWEDKFSANLVGTKPGSPRTSTELTLNPGEAKVFGLNHPKGTRWGQMLNYLWQPGTLAKSKTLDMTTREGWNYNSGFVLDWLAPTGAQQAADNHGLGVFGVSPRDTIDVGISLRAPSYRNQPVEHFSVEVGARLNGSRNRTTLGVYRYKYGNISRLEEAMELGAHPTIGKISYPVRREKPWNYNDLYQINIDSTPVEEWDGPKQFALFTLAARTSQDSLFPTKPGRDNSFVTRVLDMDITSTHPAQMPMELSFLPITSTGAGNVGSIEVVDVGGDDYRSFFFSGWTSFTGFANYPTYEVPRQPLLNLADLRHANLASSGHLPLPPYTVGESHPHPTLSPAEAISALGPFGYQMADHAWLANNTLWDSYYFSGLRKGSEVSEFFDNGIHPINPRLQPHLPAGESLSSLVDKLDSGEGYLSSAGSHLLKGTFNVNSTSIPAWKALLMSLKEVSIPNLNPSQLTNRDDPSSGSPFPRLLDGPSGSLKLPMGDNQQRWTGFRDLSDTEIETLAVEIVEQVRERGPFLSLSEFINRRLDGKVTDTALGGVLERAIAESSLNRDAAPLGGRFITNEDATRTGYGFPEAAEGSTEEGASAFLTQGDLLSAIGASLSVRSDTFVIRAYGESREGNTVVATAVCEAVIQRLPEFVDPSSPYDQRPGDSGPDLGEINANFGRRLEIISFRWVSPDEVRI